MPYIPNCRALIFGQFHLDEIRQQGDVEAQTCLTGKILYRNIPVTSSRLNVLMGDFGSAYKRGVGGGRGGVYLGVYERFPETFQIELIKRNLLATSRIKSQSVFHLEVPIEPLKRISKETDTRNTGALSYKWQYRRQK